MNILGSLHSPVVNTTESLDSPVVNTPEKSLFPCDEYTRELTSWCIWNKHQNRFTKKFSDDKKVKESRLLPVTNYKGVSTP
jgi:hypothetical protein